MLPKKFYDEIEHFDNKVVLVSGGRDSSAIALDFFDSEIFFFALHNNTGLRMPGSKKSIEKILLYAWEYVLDYFEISSKEYLEWRDDGKTVRSVLDDAFSNVDKIFSNMENKGRYDRNLLKCCDLLKKYPFNWFLRNQDYFNKDDTVIISGISPGESQQRRLRLAELRNRDTYLREYKHNGFTYGYPLRDEGTTKLVDAILLKHGFEDVSGSGCVLCPVLLLFRMFDKDPIRYAKTKRYFLKNFRGARFCGKLDHTLDEFLEVKV